MENLDKLHEWIEKSTMVLIVNDNKKPILQALFNLIYNKYPYKKVSINTCKGFNKRVTLIKNKLIKVDLDLNKIQFTSSNNSYIQYQHFMLIKSFLIDNNSKLLLKTNYFSYFHMSSELKSIFNLIIKINDNNIQIIRLSLENSYFNQVVKEEMFFDISVLIRSVKLKQLQNKIINKKICFNYK